MTDVTSSSSKMQLEETEYLDSLGANTISKIGANINDLIDNSSAEVLGEVKMTILTENQFIDNRSTGWVLMQGQDITGSDFAVLTGVTTLPDQRGLFIRVLDNGRGVDTGRVLGTTQDDEVFTHQHNIVRDGTAAGSLKDFTDGSMRLAGPPSLGPASTGTTAGRSGTTGGDEFRPKNIAVNFFIRINT